MSATPFRQVADDFFVAPQLAAADFAAAQAAGIRTVINNRPDGEAPDQLTDARGAASSPRPSGLAYAFVPVVSGGIGPDAIAAFAAAVAANPGPHLAYCRSGTRSCSMWAFATAAERPVETTIEAAAAAGYDLTPALPILRAARRRLNLSRQLRQETAPRRPAPAAGRTAPRSPPAWPRADQGQASPSRAAISSSQGRLLGAEPGAGGRQQLGVAQPRPSRPRSRR